MYLIQDLTIARRAMFEICLVCQITFFGLTVPAHRSVEPVDIGISSRSTPKSLVSCSFWIWLGATYFYCWKPSYDSWWSERFLTAASRSEPQGTLLSERHFPKAAGKDLGISQTWHNMTKRRNTFRLWIPHDAWICWRSREGWRTESKSSGQRKGYWTESNFQILHVPVPGSNLGKLHIWLVVWNMNFLTVHSVGNVIIPTDELIFFRGVGIPPTSYILRGCHESMWIYMASVGMDDYHM